MRHRENIYICIYMSKRTMERSRAHTDCSRSHMWKNRVPLLPQYRRHTDVVRREELLSQRSVRRNILHFNAAVLGNPWWVICETLREAGLRGRPAAPDVM